jgi:hypothetical protein
MNVFKYALYTAVIGLGLVGTNYAVGCLNGEEITKTELKHMSVENIQNLSTNSLKYDKIVSQVTSSVELVLLEEQGTANLTFESFDSEWNKKLTRCTTELTLDYSVKLSLPTTHVNFVRAEDRLIVIVDKNDLTVSSLEVLNKNIKVDRAIFGHKPTDKEKFTLEQRLVKDVKEKALGNVHNVNRALKAFEDYMDGIVKTLEVDIQIIVK